MLRFDFDFDLSDAFQRIADAVEGFLAKDAEPQPAPTYGCEQMKTMLRHLSHALHFGDPAWPHTESQAQLAIRYLEVIAKSVVWGQTHDDSIVACFLDEGGLSILIRALLTYDRSTRPGSKCSGHPHPFAPIYEALRCDLQKLNSRPYPWRGVVQARPIGHSIFGGHSEEV